MITEQEIREAHHLDCRDLEAMIRDCATRRAPVARRIQELSDSNTITHQELLETSRLQYVKGQEMLAAIAANEDARTWALSAELRTLSQRERTLAAKLEAGCAAWERLNAEESRLATCQERMGAQLLELLGAVPEPMDLGLCDWPELPAAPLTDCPF